MRFHRKLVIESATSSRSFDAESGWASRGVTTMAMWSDKKEYIFKAVEQMYTDVASRPGAVFHFPTGRLACLFVGYPAKQLDCLPAEATESFAGVGYPFAADVIREGDTVLDIGSGSGTDALITAMLTGPTGTVQSATTSGEPRGYSGLASCIASSVRSWQFPASGGTTVANVPFVFAGQ